MVVACNGTQPKMVELSSITSSARKRNVIQYISGVVYTPNSELVDIRSNGNKVLNFVRIKNTFANPATLPISSHNFGKGVYLLGEISKFKSSAIRTLFTVLFARLCRVILTSVCVTTLLASVFSSIFSGFVSLKFGYRLDLPALSTGLFSLICRHNPPRSLVAFGARNTPLLPTVDIFSIDVKIDNRLLRAAARTQLVSVQHNRVYGSVSALFGQTQFTPRPHTVNATSMRAILSKRFLYPTTGASLHDFLHDQYDTRPKVVTA